MNKQTQIGIKTAILILLASWLMACWSTGKVGSHRVVSNVEDTVLENPRYCPHLASLGLDMAVLQAQFPRASGSPDDTIRLKNEILTEVIEVLYNLHPQTRGYRYMEGIVNNNGRNRNRTIESIMYKAVEMSRACRAQYWTPQQR